MNWKDVGGLIGKGAPLVGGLLGGPAGAAVGELVSKALGVAPTPQSVAKALELDPMAMAKVIEVQSAERVRLAELAAEQVTVETTAGIDMAKVDAGDRDSARKREMDVRDRIPAILAVLVTTGFFGVLGFLLVNGKPAEGGDALLVMLGSLGTAWASIIAYYFGSSAGSAQKTRLLAQTAEVR